MFEAETRLGEAIASRAGNLKAFEVNIETHQLVILIATTSKAFNLYGRKLHDTSLKVLLEQQVKALHCDHHLMLVIKASEI